MNNLATLNKEEIIEALKQSARESWTGEIGESRAVEIEKFLRQMLENYSKILGLPEEQILKAIEKTRSYSAINFYQVSKFPKIEEGVEIFETPEDFVKKFPSKKYICPHCKGISTDAYECNSGVEVTLINGKGKKEKCNWKSYGLFGTLSGGYRAIVKSTFLEHPAVHDIFKPLELQEIA